MPLPYLEFVGGTQVCTSLFVRRPDGRILLGLRHYKKEILNGASVWTTPGGRCEEAERILENILRELYEETGITADQIVIDGFVGIAPGAKENDTLYIYTGLTTAEPRLMEPEKFSEWQWLEVDAVPGEFINPGALRLYKMYLDRPQH